MRVVAALVSLLAGSALVGGAMAIGCSSSSSGGAACAKIDSQCGQPCNPGNALGVGQYCDHITDCSNTPMAHLCSSLGSLTTHFCTFRCSWPDAAVPDGGDGGLPFPTDCGEGASCTCDNDGNCGCTPTVCLGP